MKTPTVFLLNRKSLLLQWKHTSLEKVQDTVRDAQRQLQDHFQDRIVEIVLGYGELAVYLNDTSTARHFAHKLKTFKFQIQEGVQYEQPRLITIPVCYSEPYALDSRELAAHHDCSVAALVQLHTAPTYTVSFLGFLPGFPYLIGLPNELATPRKTTPRPHVAAGSVGIGGAQTGVYTQESPGGWHIIGRTPVSFFSVENSPPAFLRAGDKVQFKSISVKEYEQIQQEVQQGKHRIETTVYYG